MSLNIVDSLLDKLSFVSKDKNIPFGNKFTGSQHFLGTNNYISQSIPTEFQTAFMNNEYYSLAHNKMNRSSSLDSKMNLFHHFESSSNSLVSRVSKVFAPMLSYQDSYRILPNYMEMFHDPELFLKQEFKALCEEVEQHYEKLNKRLDSNINSGKNSSQMQASSVESTCKQPEEVYSNMKSDRNTHQTKFNCVDSKPTNELNKQSEPRAVGRSQSSLLANLEISTNQSQLLKSHLKSNKDTCHLTNLPSSDKNPSKEVMMQDLNVSSLEAVVLPDNKKLLACNNRAMNEKLTNRKNKEIQKRSKKRRRRQKKNNIDLNKDCATKSKKDLAKQNASNPANTSLGSAPSDSGTKNSGSAPSGSGSKSDILCDIMTITENASGVQILLPDSSSFLISIESAEEDSDWDNNSDCEWLNDCSEFEFSGIFISNLSAPLTSTFSKSLYISQLSVPSSPDEVEVRRLGAALRRVNDNWVKAMKGLDTKPRVATKVSFAPDDELVETVQVEMFDRKGEWEMYATERMRFKRRIDELEKIISPCLSEQHREKIFLRFQGSDL